MPLSYADKKIQKNALVRFDSFFFYLQLNDVSSSTFTLYISKGTIGYFQCRDGKKL